jgi:RNA polymerase sigma-70 factor (ECF subfamily)
MVEDHRLPQDGESSRWIESARQGNHEAWEHLHRRYRSLLAFWAEARLPDHLRARFDVEDVLQSAFLSAFRGMSKYEHRGEPAFRAWLKEIVQNELADRIRDHEARKRSARQEEVLEDPSLLLGGETPSQIVSRFQRRRLVLEAMSELSDERQEVLWMRDFEGLTWEEIGKRTDTSESGARRRYRTALVALVSVLRKRRGLLE